jgi:hypothetical protein
VRYREKQRIHRRNKKLQENREESIHPWKHEEINPANSILIDPVQSVGATSTPDGTERALPRGALLWLNLLCLDAPLVAICWQWVFARSLHLAVTASSTMALFLTAWFIYVVDRFTDSISLSADVPKSAREMFCFTHRRLWLLLMPAIALFDVAIVCSRLDHGTRVHGVILAAAAGLYFVVNNRFSKIWTAIPIKEIAIGALFAAGTLLVFAPHLASARSTTAFAAFLFAALCWLNCVSIAFWERDLDWAQRKHSVATRWPQVAAFAPTASITLALAAGALDFFDHQLAPLAICLGLSAVLLGALHVAPVSRDERTALADLVLLTPLMLFVTEKIL